jgi:hypothetical protein
MNEATYQALKMAQDYHERKFASNPDQSYPTMIDILATAKEIYDWILENDIQENEDGFTPIIPNLV